MTVLCPKGITLCQGFQWGLLAESQSYFQGFLCSALALCFPLLPYPHHVCCKAMSIFTARLDWVHTLLPTATCNKNFYFSHVSYFNFYRLPTVFNHLRRKCRSRQGWGKERLNRWNVVETLTCSFFMLKVQFVPAEELQITWSWVSVCLQ